MTRNTILRALALGLAASALSACAPLQGLQILTDKTDPLVGKVKVVEVIPGSIPITQFIGRECGGTANIAFEDQEGKLHIAREPHKPYCHLKDGDSIGYKVFDGRYVVYPLAHQPVKATVAK